MERKVCFILDAVTGVSGRADVSPKSHSLPLRPNNQWARTFLDQWQGLHGETAQSARIVILKLVTGSLTNIVLIVLDAANLWVQG